MKSIKKSIVILLIALIIVTCFHHVTIEDYDYNYNAKPYNDTIIVDIEGGIDIGEHYQIITVKAVISNKLGSDWRSDGDTIPTMTADFVDGQFVMTLPTILYDDIYFNYEYNNISNPHGYSKISNPNVKILYVTHFNAYNTEGVCIGAFEYISSDIKYWDTAKFWYVDDDVLLYFNGGRFNLSLKKGWNIQYKNEETLSKMKWEFCAN
jgi:hypothetical protein